MNVLEEKVFIYGMMKDITTERRKLVDMYYGLKERLDFLNSIEERGIEQLSIKGYVDLHNQTQKEIAVTNIMRETHHQIEKIENEYHNNIEEKEKSVIPEEIIQESIAQENRIKRKRISPERIDNAVVSILKDAGMPLKLNELLKRTNFVLKEDKVSSTNFQTKVLPRILEKNKKVERPMRGFYQYKL